MALVLRIVVIAACVLLLAYVFHLVKHDRLLLNYSLMWLALAAVILLCAVFPRPLFGVAAAFGFATASNFIFFVGFLFLLVICLVLTSIVSKQALSIKNLTQKIALMEKENEKGAENQARRPL